MLPLRFIMLALLPSLLALSLSAHISTNTDTLRHIAANKTDLSGMRQGYWKFTGAMSSDRAYRKEQLVEEGGYVDNKRQGIWVKYYPSGTPRSEINYDNNQPRGEYRIFYESGKLEEEGDWQGNRNVGSFKRYHANGKLAQEFTFNEFGKRHGTQKYYFPNGQVQMTVEVENGTAHGNLKTYYSNGDPKSEKRINNGLLDEASVREYKPSNKLQTTRYPDPELPMEETLPNSVDRPNLAEFKETGFNTLYNRNQQITQVGDFKDGRLWNGKWHRYDSDGILRKIEVYREGRFMGLAPVDEALK